MRVEVEEQARVAVSANRRRARRLTSLIHQAAARIRRKVHLALLKAADMPDGNCR